jgi:hypothetical protein
MVTIFTKFSGEVDAIQQQYEQLKADPPVPRNVPAMVGHIMWSRMLQERLEGPMKQFQQNETVMKTKVTQPPFSLASLCRVNCTQRYYVWRLTA